MDTKTATAVAKPVAKVSAKPKLAVRTPVTSTFPRDITDAFAELRSAVSLPSAVSERTPLSAVSRTSAFRDPIPSSGLPSAGLPSGRSCFFYGPGPMSATCFKIEENGNPQKTPITPPIAYLDFLKGMSIQSPSMTSPPQTGNLHSLNRTSTTSSTTSHASTDSVDSSASANSAEDSEKGTKTPLEEESPPTSAASEATDVSCTCEHQHSHPQPPVYSKSPMPKTAAVTSSAPSDAINTTTIPISPFSANHLSRMQHPMSAPATGAATFPSLKVPASPAGSVSVAAAVAAAVASEIAAASPRTPFSSRSLHSPFDWDAALKARRYAEVPGAAALAKQAPNSANKPTTPIAGTKRDSSTRTVVTSPGGAPGVRHIREVVTRTVTYTPRVGPAPKGKRRKVDHETAVES
jgi:hypothetical protein